MTDKQIEKFWSKVQKSDHGCWDWMGHKDKNGYGDFKVNQKQWRAHRLSYKLVVSDPGILHVLHKCDNPGCVRPDHLFLGTNRDNVKDRQNKQRQYRKIDWDTAREIRRRYAEGNIKVRELDDEFGYIGTIAIIKNRIWYDPEYHPPKGRLSGPKRITISIDGETKNLRQWASDPRCEICYTELRRRFKEGSRGPSILKRHTKRGRPRDEIKDRERDAIIRELDAQGEMISKINKTLRERGFDKVTKKYIASLTKDFVVPPDIDAKLKTINIPSEFCCHMWTREFETPIPMSVMMRYMVDAND